MTNNIQMFQYNGSEYNQLNPSLSNLSNNSNQLGGVDSSQYATKEYVNRASSKKLIHNSNVIFNTQQSVVVELQNEINFSNIDSLFIELEFNSDLVTSGNSSSSRTFEIGIRNYIILLAFSTYPNTTLKVNGLTYRIIFCPIKLSIRQDGEILLPSFLSGESLGESGSNLIIPSGTQLYFESYASNHLVTTDFNFKLYSINF